MAIGQFAFELRDQPAHRFAGGGLEARCILDRLLPVAFGLIDADQVAQCLRRALVDARRLGLSLMALISISMDKHTPERFANFEALVGDIPEVLECLLITGQQSDYQLKVVVRDMDHYQHLLLHKLTRIEGVTGVHSSFVLRRVFDERPVPLV